VALVPVSDAAARPWWLPGRQPGRRRGDGAKSLSRFTCTPGVRGGLAASSTHSRRRW